MARPRNCWAAAALAVVLALAAAVGAAGAQGATSATATAGSESAARRNLRPSELYEAPLVQLNDSNFDALVGLPGTRWVVEFYADWCGHCNNLAPSYQEMANRIEQLKAEAAEAGSDVADAWYNISVGAVNVDRAPGLSVRFQITGIPRLFVIDGSTVYNYPTKQRARVEQPLETGEWKSQSILQGTFIAPFGVVARIISAIARAGMWLLSISDVITATYGVPLAAQAVGFLVVVILASVLLGIVLQSLLEALLPRPAAPAPARAPGQAAPAETKKTK